MPPKTFSDWWKTFDGPSSTPYEAAVDAWKACEASRPTFETLVAQLGEAQRENERLRAEAFQETQRLQLVVQQLNDAISQKESR